MSGGANDNPFEGQSYNPFQNVSWSSPFGGSALAQGGQQLANNLDAIDTSISKAYRGTTTPTNTQVDYARPGTASTPTAIAPPPLALNGLAGARDTSQEDALRNSYQKALNPNYGFTFTGQSSPNNVFNAVPGAKGK